MSPAAPIRTRSDLLKLLCEAAELEHGIACSYLYAAFPLKRDISEGGITWDEQQKIRRWAAQLYFIASQEMLHLALVWNVTTAIGGTPYYLRPNFPQNTKYYPLNVPIELEPFVLRSLADSSSTNIRNRGLRVWMSKNDSDFQATPPGPLN